MEEGKKKNKGLIVLVVILILIILGLVGYIMYGTNVVYKHFKAEESTTQKDEETVISNELTNELLDKVPYSDHVIDYENKDLVPYYNDKYIVSDIDEKLLIYEAYNAAVNTSYIDTFEKGDFPTGTGGGKCIKLANLNDFLKEDYNITIKGETKEFESPELGIVAMFYMSEEDICLVPQEGGMVSSYITSKLDKARYNGDDIELYTTVLFNYTAWNGETIDHTLTSDPEYKNILEKFTEKETDSDISLNNEKLFQKYYNQGSKYKHTFKLNDDGSYYWYSTEKVGD